MTIETQLAEALSKVPDIGARAAPPRFKQGRASLMLDVGGLSEQSREALDAGIRAALLAVSGVTEVRIFQTAERRGRSLIAVGSGKGGVGKSTVSANLALALKRQGRNVGLIDADIYGPSQPRLLATEGIRPMAKGQQLEPVMSPHGFPMLSMGQLVEPGKALAWRGPMAGNALGQLIDADWGDTDLIIVDLPPGTGDVQLSMIQKHKPAGAVIVSTPQDLALIDAERAIDLFNKAGVPIIGLIENMAGYQCPNCGEVSDPFGHGGTETEAARLGLPFLGRIPLAMAIREASDAGTLAQVAAFEGVAAELGHWLENKDAADV
jgi:ATP-binding protein involved in chromosome partitioning